MTMMTPAEADRLTDEILDLTQGDADLTRDMFCIALGTLVAHVTCEEAGARMSAADSIRILLEDTKRRRAQKATEPTT